MSKATSRVAPPPRKPEATGPIPDEYLTPRWGDDDLRRVLALACMGVFVFGASWLTWRASWLLWPAGLCALALQVSATMIAARAAVQTSDRRGPAARRRAPAPPRESLLTILSRLVPAEEATPDPEPVDEEPAEPVLLELPGAPPSLNDEALHRAFFRGILDAEFAEHPAGTAWPDLSALQGSLTTRLRLYQRHASFSPMPAGDVSTSERSAHSPWRHLATLDAVSYRRDDTVARLSHRALAPLAFLELHARMDLESDERQSLEAEVSRQYTVGYGRILTPPSVLAAAEPLRRRMGGQEAIALADEARLALRSTASMGEAERVRCEWHGRARALRAAMGWSGEVQSLLEGLIDYWLVQRAAAADVEWAEEMSRLEGIAIGEALARRDADGTFQFAETLRRICYGAYPAVADTAPTVSAGATGGATTPGATPTTLMTVA